MNNTIAKDELPHVVAREELPFATIAKNSRGTATET